MLLVIDVGNTNMVFGVFEGETLTGTFRLTTDTNRTSDEIGLAVWDYFQRFGLPMQGVEDVIIASVVPQVMHSLTNAMVKYCEKTPYIVDDGVDPGLPYGVASDERLGPDRAMACIAAIAKYGAPLVVLDFGTATTLDAISAEGAYMGGCITAGVSISAEALFAKAARLPKVELIVPETVLGVTAVSQIQAGAMLGYLGSMEYLITRAKAELGYGDATHVVATGGLARTMSEQTSLIDFDDAGLVLDGLRLIYAQHMRAQS